VAVAVAAGQTTVVTMVAWATAHKAESWRFGSLVVCVSPTLLLGGGWLCTLMPRCWSVWRPPILDCWIELIRYPTALASAMAKSDGTA
jgi:hypothetical protein